jgi:hypothetical protein
MNTWLISTSDFVTFSDGLVFKPAYVSVTDTMSFSETLTTTIFQARALDGMHFSDTVVVNGLSIHHVTIADSLVLLDDAMRNAPQFLVDHMVLGDAFEVAPNLLTDAIIFNDEIAGTDTTGLYDTIVFADMFPTPSFVWGANTGALSDTISILDIPNGYVFPKGKPSPYTPNYPLTTRRSNNPSCAQSSGMIGLPY